MEGITGGASQSANARWKCGNFQGVAGAAGVALRFGLRDFSNWLANLFFQLDLIDTFGASKKNNRHASLSVSASHDVQSHCLSDAREVLRL